MESPYVESNPCTCDDCAYDELKEDGTIIRKPRTVLHWFCSQCGSGPFNVRRQPWFYRQQLPPSGNLRTHISPTVLYFCCAGCQLHIARDNAQREALAAGKWSTVGNARSQSDGEGN